LRRLGRERFLDRRRDGEIGILDADPRESVDGDRFGLGGDRCDDVAFVADAVDRDDRLVLDEEGVVRHDVRGQIFAC
jgi:hypothetical protein